jgi:hypothetical protein
MYKLVPWTPELNLENFYRNATDKGYDNNSSQTVLVDCFNNEREKQVWILYYNNQPVGSVAAHSFPEMGANAYRICARTCVLTDHTHFNHLRTLKKTIQQHQNITAQYYIPQCIGWAGASKDLYISSNESAAGSQRLVHNIYCPALEKIGTLSNCGTIDYRGTEQTVWKLNVFEFFRQLSLLPRWPLENYDATGTFNSPLHRQVVGS